MKPLLILALALLPSLARCAELGAVTRQMVRPVLIRNEHNSLLQLTINAKKPFVQVQAITVELEGATELESLQFYFTGVDGGFSTMKTFWRPAAVAQVGCIQGARSTNGRAEPFLAVVPGEGGSQFIR